MRLLLATRNPAKLEEIVKYLGDGFELICLADLENTPQVEETGATFRANAIMKAEKYFRWSQMPTLADDGGLEIDALRGDPGVKSRRWSTPTEVSAGRPSREKTDQELIDMALERLLNIPMHQRQARLVTVGAFYDGQLTLTQSGWADGFITESQTEQCKPGYPFRSIFWVPQFNKLFSQLTEEEHEIINHRKKVYEVLALKIAELAH